MSAFYKRLSDGRFLIILSEKEARMLVEETDSTPGVVLGEIHRRLPFALNGEPIYTDKTGVAPPEETAAHEDPLAGIEVNWG